MLHTATTLDFRSIRAIVHEVWPIAYKEMISAEQITYMLEMMYSDESLTRQMNEEDCEFIMASHDGEALGFASYSHVGSNQYKLHKLYVYTHQQGKGVGKTLLEEVKERAKSRGGKSVELQVNKRNKAQKFYLKHGFMIERELVLDIGNGFVMDDFIMRCALV